MTEAEWLNCEQPDRMLEFVHDRASPRKWRLLACAFCRRVWNLLKDKRSRRAVELAEGFADGSALASPHALAEACQGAWDAWSWVAKPAIGLTEMTYILDSTLAAECQLEPTEARRDRCALIREIFGNPFHCANRDGVTLPSA